MLSLEHHERLVIAMAGRYEDPNAFYSMAMQNFDESLAAEPQPRESMADRVRQYEQEVQQLDVGVA